MSGKSGAIKAGAAYVEIFADKSSLMRGLRAAEISVRKWGNTISTFGRQMMTVGTAILAPLIGAAKYFSTYGDNIAKMSRRTGVAVESLSALGFAAEQEGSSLETVEKGIRKMQQSILDANMGLKTTTDVFAMLGVSAASFAGLKPEEQFRLMADRLSQIEDPSKRAAIAMKIFGRSGTALLPLFEKGAAGMDELMNEAKQLGLVLSGDDALAAEKLNDAINRMWRTMKMAFANIGAAIAPIITEISDKMALVIGKTSNWIKENRGVVGMAMWLGVALVGAGGAFYAFGKALIFTSKMFGIVHSGFALLKTALLTIMSPLGLVVIAITAATAGFLYFSGYGAKALQWLGERFNELREDATAAIGGISAAFAKGDMGLAARIGWLFVKMEWLKAKQWMLEIWYSVKLAIMEFWYAAVYGIVDSWNTAIYSIQVAWIETVALIQRVWTNAGAILKGAWIDCVGFFKTLWAGFKQFFGDTVAWMAKKLMNIWIWWKKITDPTFDEKGARADIDSTFAAEDDQRAATADADILKIDKEQDAKRLQLETKTQTELDGIEKTRTGKRGDTKKVYDSQMDASQQIVTDGLQGVIDSSNASMKKVAQELAATKDEFNSSIAKAKEPVAPKVNPKLPNKDWETKNGLEKADSAGTFSSFRLGEMGVSSTLQSIAANTQRTAEATEDMADNAGNSGSEFGE